MKDSRRIQVHLYHVCSQWQRKGAFFYRYVDMGQPGPRLPRMSGDTNPDFDTRGARQPSSAEQGLSGGKDQRQ